MKGKIFPDLIIVNYKYFPAITPCYLQLKNKFMENKVFVLGT